MTDQSHKTAISRRKLSLPMRYLDENDYFRHGAILDFGCGRGTDADILSKRFRRPLLVKRYDPHYFPKMPGKSFHMVTCHYVLNVVKQPGKVLKEAWKRVRRGGWIAVSVRGKIEVVREATKAGWEKSGSGYVTGSGTYQRGFTMKQLVKLARGLGGVQTIEEIRLPGSQAVMVVAYKA